jgi:Amt family ammonium transporter
VVWCAVATALILLLARVLFGGLRVDSEAERQGLDISSHGERAYEG